MDNPARAAILRAMKMDSDIVIVGGGLNGPALALALAQHGLSVTMVDARARAERADRDFDGRSYALAMASVRLLRRLGIWAGIEDRTQPMLDIKVSDGRAGAGPLTPFSLHFDHAELEEGPMGHMCEDRVLRPALLDAADAAEGVTVMSGDSVVAQEVDGTGATLTLASGKALRTRLIVGSDGRSSGTAQRAGIGRTGWGYGQTALVCGVAHERPHHGIAHQFFMPAGPLAILPLPGNVSSIVWSERNATATAFAALDDAAFLAVLRPRFGDFLGDIAIKGRRYTYPLGLSLAKSLIAPRLALVGDAAHGLHPIAGQGLNAGLRDVAALAQVLGEARARGEDIAAFDVLERYQRWRRFDIAALAATTDLSNRLFSSDNPVLRGLRDLGMGAVQAAAPLRRALMREAAGLSGDLPDLMR